MKSTVRIIITLLIFCPSKIIAQPFADIVSFNYQTFSTNGAYDSSSKNTTDNYFLNFFLPKELKSGHTLLVRLNTEMINSSMIPDTTYSSRLSAISLPVGMKLVTKNKKWETVFLIVPKIASDFKDPINSSDYQLGGVFLQHYVASDKLKIKAGLYYNREAFGNFFVPLVGVDWKVNDRLSLYGILPTNYKVEYNIIKNKLYSGVNLKFFTRSFRLSQESQYNYVRYNESQIKLFMDYFVVPKVLVFAEVGYSLGRTPLQYKYNKDNVLYGDPIYAPVLDSPIFSFGIAYRVRWDLVKKADPLIQ